MTSTTPPVIGIIGGTGKEGSGLALRWARAGLAVVIGSRQAEKAEHVAAELNAKLGADRTRGLSNREAVHLADLCVLTVPYAAHRTTLESLRDDLQGKVLVDVTVPIRPPVTHVHIPPEGPAAVQAQAILGDGVRVVAAFQNVGEHYLKDADRPIECDVLVCGDDADAKAAVIELAQALDPQIRAFDAGPLVNAVAIESLTPLLIGLSRQFKRLRVGLRITGIG